jgi:pSer/pThr/pTyr-binding forkhead associated (FHA) protein
MQWPILGERFAIGREARCDAALNDPPKKNKRNSVSRKHALITCSDDQWFIEDGDGEGKESHNGTLLNDELLPFPGRRALRDKDRIQICDFKLVFHLDPDSKFSVEDSVSHSDSNECLDSQPAERLRLLLEITATLRGTLDPDAVLERTLDHLFKMFPQAQRGLIIFRENSTGPMVIRVMRTPRGEPVDPNFSTSVVRLCLETLEAILGDDLPEQFPESESVSSLPSRSLMCAPLWSASEQALGVIQLDRRMDGLSFTSDDLKLFLGVANQASISLSNARLHREMMLQQQRTRDMELAQQVRKGQRNKPC